MSVILRWEDPPPPRRGFGDRGRWAENADLRAIADELRANPGRWAVVAEAANPGSATHIRTGHYVAFRPVGHFEATLRGLQVRGSQPISRPVRRRSRSRASLRPGGHRGVGRLRAAQFSPGGYVMKRTPMKSRPRNTGPSTAVVALVWERDSGRCAACAGAITGERGYDWSVQHRSPRRAGSTRRPWINLPGNLVLLHGHGTSLCNGDVESDRTRWTAAGFLVRDGVLLPVEVPILHAVHGGWTMLADDGGVEVFPRCPECRCDPMTCELDPIGAHCEDRSCPTCLHGCPLDDCSACGDSLPERAS